MNIIKQFLKRDISALTREQLKGIDLDVSYLEDMTEKEKKDFLGKAELIAKNDVLDRIIDRLIKSQIDFTVKGAKDMEQVNFGRATINGLTLLREEINRLSALYNDEIKPAEEFDKYDIL